MLRSDAIGDHLVLLCGTAEKICPEGAQLVVFCESKSMKNLTLHDPPPFFPSLHVHVTYLWKLQCFHVLFRFLWNSCKESRFMLPLAMHHLNCEGKNWRISWQQPIGWSYQMSQWPLAWYCHDISHFLFCLCSGFQAQHSVGTGPRSLPWTWSLDRISIIRSQVYFLI